MYYHNELTKHVGRPYIHFWIILYSCSDVCAQLLQVSRVTDRCTEL